jgi:hypothetical protein
MLMSMEEVASREVVRLGNQLLEFETEERNRPLRGLPEKLLKTKGQYLGEGADFQAPARPKHVSCGFWGSLSGRSVAHHEM